MSTFYLLTDHAVAGPFSGLELREAALAGILRHDGIVGASAQGPWYKASDIGLYSEKKTPLPHPPDTSVPQYHVRGMPGAFQGPFKLRELIGFAARGMLPPDALIQVDETDTWEEVRRFRMLSAVLKGALVLVDDRGKLLVRNISAADPEKHLQVEGTHAPIDLVQAADMHEATSRERTASDDEAPDEQWTAPSIAFGPGETSAPAPSKVASLWSACRQRMPRPQRWIPPRLAIQIVCLLLVFAGVASAFTYWKQLGLQRDAVIGDWIAYDPLGEQDSPVCGISLKPDGQCVIFNATGDSWTGDFVWESWRRDSSEFHPASPVSTVVSQPSPTHRVGTIESTDGFVRLQGFVKDPPQIDQHPVRDLFLRRDSDRLFVGYLTAVHWTSEETRMEAGWMQMNRWMAPRPDPVAELRRLEVELPVPVGEFGGEKPPHLSAAIDAAQRGVSGGESEDVILHESMAYSLKVDAAYLLQHYGVPDEARRIYRFEIPNLRNGPSFDGAQVVRYGRLKFFLSSDGRLRYVAYVDETLSGDQPIAGSFNGATD